MTRSLTSLLLALTLWLLLVLGCVPPTKKTTTTASGGTPLELLSFRGERQYSYLTIHGQVKNISSEKLEGVWAVVEFYDANGSMVTSQDGVIEYSPILPGQTSPFTIMERDNPAIKTFKCNFKYLFGGVIPYKDSTSQSTPTPDKKSRRR